MISAKPMEIEARIVADSKNEFGNRITTFVLTYPRIIHAEFMTHRMFSRNAASSRAVPFEKLVKSVEETPFIPLAFQKTHKGMQGSEYFTDPDINTIKQEWLFARDEAVKSAKILNEVGVTKQLVNRLLEPFQYYTSICTATEWENFFALRCPQYQPLMVSFRSKKDLINHYKKSGKLLDGTEVDRSGTAKLWEQQSDLEWLKVNKGQAEIHMMALAEAMWDAYNESMPKELKAGEWHIPYEEEVMKIIPSPLPINAGMSLNEALNEAKIKVSTVMAARTSYTVVGMDGTEWTYDKYVKKHDELVSANPLHASPLEHCAQAMGRDKFKCQLPIPKQFEYLHMEWSGNFKGWTQYRKMFEN